MRVAGPATRGFLRVKGSEYFVVRGGCGLEILRAGRVRVRNSSCGSGAGRVRVGVGGLARFRCKRIASEFEFTLTQVALSCYRITTYSIPAI